MTLINGATEASSLVDRKKSKSISKILKYLYLKGPSSIAQLSKHINSSVPSTTAVVNELIDGALIKENGASKTKSGRRPVFFSTNGQNYHILVININLYEVSFHYLDLENNITNETSHKKDITDTNYPVFLEEAVKGFLLDKDNPWAIGISSPGLIDQSSGINNTHQSLNPSPGQSLSDYISLQLGIPTFGTNDTQAAMMGEHHYGLAKGKKNVLSINLDWGIGMGILINGKILKGKMGYAGELGHIQVDPNGDLCSCGKIGCLDTVASASTVIRRAKEGLANGQLSSLSKIKGEINLQEVVNAANKGDEFSIDILFDLGRELGKGISIAVHLFNPEAVIIDGILTEAGDLIVSTLKQSINKYCLLDFRKELEILVSPLKDLAKVYGVKSHAFLNMIAVD